MVLNFKIQGHFVSRYFKIGPLGSQINVEFNITDRQTSRQTIRGLQSEKLGTEKGRDIHVFCFHCLLTGIWCEVILMELMSRQLSTTRWMSQ